MVGEVVASSGLSEVLSGDEQYRSVVVEAKPDGLETTTSSKFALPNNET
jgi:hypothetical protein